MVYEMKPSKLFADIRARATDRPVIDGVVAKGFAFPEDVLRLLEAIDVMGEQLTKFADVDLTSSDKIYLLRSVEWFKTASAECLKRVASLEGKK